MSTIIINATATKTSGALTVLKDCTAYIEQNPIEFNEYHLFTVVNDFDTLKNVHVHKLRQKNWLSRIQWDNGGLQRWCRAQNVEPDAIVSLQNTSTKYKNKAGLMIVQVVYYHQPIPLYQRNGLDRSLKTLMYRYMYPIFVSRNNTTSHYIVQLPYIKELFCRRFKKITPNRVTVIRPNKPEIDIQNIAEKVLDTEGHKYNFLYPATPLSYKNHAVLISALVKLQKENPDVIKNITIFLTVERLSEHLMNDIASNNLESCVQLIGQVPYKELLSYYKSSGVLLFPSKIESFGFPLLEASCFGLPVIASDLPYAREVLDDYTNKYFIDPDNVGAWAEAIGDYEKYNKVMHVKTVISKNTWKDFFDLINKLILEQKHDGIQ